MITDKQETEQEAAGIRYLSMLYLLYNILEAERLLWPVHTVAYNRPHCGNSDVQFLHQAQVANQGCLSFDVTRCLNCY